MQGSLGGSGVRGRCRQQVPLRTTGGRDTRSLWGWMRSAKLRLVSLRLVEMATFKLTDALFACACDWVCLVLAGWGSVHGGQRDGARGSCQPGGPAGQAERSPRPAGQSFQGGGSLPGTGHAGTQTPPGWLTVMEMWIQKPPACVVTNVKNALLVYATTVLSVELNPPLRCLWS